MRSKGPSPPRQPLLRRSRNLRQHRVHRAGLFATAIICVTMPGKTSESFNGSVSDLPSSSDFLTAKARAPQPRTAVLAVMSRPSRIVRRWQLVFPEFV